MGRIPYLETPQNALQLIRPRHREIMRRLVCGQKQREIASDMGINEGRLSIIINSPLFKTELAKMERDVRAKAIDDIGDVSARVAKLQGPALDVLEKIVKDTNGKIPYTVKRAAAMDILDLSGAKKGKNEDGMNDFAQFISEAYAEAKARAFDRLNSQLDEDATVNAESGAPVIDVTGRTLPLDEAEDVALASFKITESEKPEKKDEEDVVPTANDPSGDNRADAASSSSSVEKTNGNGNGTAANASGGETLAQLLENLMNNGGISASQIQKLLDS